MADDEAYTTITTKLIWLNKASVTVRAKPPRDREVQHIPKSLIHGGDLLKLEADPTQGVENEHTFRIMAWKAKQLGWE